MASFRIGISFNVRIRSPRYRVARGVGRHWFGPTPVGHAKAADLVRRRDGDRLVGFPDFVPAVKDLDRARAWVTPPDGTWPTVGHPGVLAATR
jgi:hypothetical protein